MEKSYNIKDVKIFAGDKELVGFADGRRVNSMSKIECPHCEHDFEIEEDWEDGDEFEEECPNCNESFLVEVEYEPTFSVRKYNFVDCEECGKRFDQKYSSRIPVVANYKINSSLCDDCYWKLQMND